MSPSLKLRLLAGALFLTAAPAAAQTPETPLSEVVVTTTRLPAPLIDTSGAQVIDRADIERRNAVVAADVLSTVPGAAFSRNGDFGGVASLRLRGAPSDKTLVLIDGVPVNDPSQPAGSYDFGSLDLADVQRIEILSGPQGSLWGSDAIGGVVNILTAEPNGVRGGAEYGAYDTWRLTGAAGFSEAKDAFGITASAMRTGGISKADAAFGNTERDPFKNLTLGAGGRLEPTDGLKLEARVRYNHANTAYDSFGGPTGVIDGPDTADVASLSGFARATVTGGPLGFTHAVTVDASSIDRSYGGPFPFKASGGRADLRWLAQQDPTRVLALAFGAEHEAAHEDTGSGRQTDANTAGFAIARWSPDTRVSVTASIRRDEPQHFTGKTTARIGARTSLGGGFSLAASFGQGFKTPSLYESTYPCFECTRPGPNPNLKPETAEGWDGALSWIDPHGRGDASLTVYRLQMRDRIDYIYPTGYLNIARARSTGLDAQARLTIGAGFSIRGSFSWIDAQDSLTGAELGVARYSGTAGLDWTHGKLQASILARSQTGVAASLGRIPGFTIAEFTGGYTLSEKLRLTFRVENLFDRHYEVAYGYGEPGRSAYAGIALRY
jgi:vitamin B12 transporter